MWVHVAPSNKELFVSLYSFVITLGSFLVGTNRTGKKKNDLRDRDKQQQKPVHYLSVLLQVVVQDLRVGLLVWCQDVHEGGRGIASSSRRIDGSPAP